MHTYCAKKQTCKIIHTQLTYTQDSFYLYFFTTYFSHWNFVTCEIILKIIAHIYSPLPLPWGNLCTRKAIYMVTSVPLWAHWTGRSGVVCLVYSQPLEKLLSLKEGTLGPPPCSTSQLVAWHYFDTSACGFVSLKISLACAHTQPAQAHFGPPAPSSCSPSPQKQIPATAYMANSSWKRATLQGRVQTWEALNLNTTCHHISLVNFHAFKMSVRPHSFMFSAKTIFKAKITHTHTHVCVSKTTPLRSFNHRTSSFDIYTHTHSSSFDNTHRNTQTLFHHQLSVSN